MSIGWGIIGLGGIAGRMAAALQAADGAELVAVCSRDRTKAEEACANFGGRPYDDYSAMLADPALELVYIATPTHLHAAQAIAAAEAGKHALCEKPMALSVRDAEAMALAAERAGVRLGVGFHLRVHPVHLAMRELIGTEEIGAPVLAQGMWAFYSADWSRDSWKMDPERAGSGSIAGVGVHVLDLVRWLVGREIVNVRALSDGFSGEYPVEFLTASLLDFGDGVFGEAISSRRLRNSDDGVTVYCEHARLRGLGTMTTEPIGSLEIVRDGGGEVREVDIRDLYTLEAEACSAAVRNGTEFPATALDGVRSVELVAAVLESARRGTSVQLTT